MPPGYREALAHVHDTGFGHLARGAAINLLAHLESKSARTAKEQSRLVIDLGCGSGILSAAVATAGYDVLGYDLSPAMIRIARGRVPAGRFLAKSFVDAKLPKCLAVAAIGEIFNYQFDTRSNVAAFANALRQIHEALVPGGILIFDVAAPGRCGPKGETRNYVIADDWACLYSAKEDRARRTIVRDITTFFRDAKHGGKSYRRDEEQHVLRTIKPNEVLKALRQTGFRPRRLKSYANTKPMPGLVPFLAIKSTKS